MSHAAQTAFQEIIASIDSACENLSQEDYLEVLQSTCAHVGNSIEALHDASD